MHTTGHATGPALGATPTLAGAPRVDTTGTGSADGGRGGDRPASRHVAAARVDVRKVLPALCLEARSEVLICGAAGTPAVRRGVRCRALLGSTGAPRPEGHQVEVRVADDLPGRFTVVDGRTALVHDPVGTGSGGLLIREPAVVSSMLGMFRFSWEAWRSDRTATVRARTAVDLELGPGSPPAPTGTDGPVLAPRHQDVLAALRDGLTDEMGARALGVSLRTYRRHVAEVMSAVQARSRFQAGALLAGHLEALPGLERR